MASANRLDIHILGTSFSIRSTEDEAYLKRILWYLEKKIQETRKKTSVSDPVKISILTSFYIIDEFLREKSLEGQTDILPAESLEMEKIISRLLLEIDRTFPD